MVGDIDSFPELAPCTEINDFGLANLDYLASARIPAGTRASFPDSQTAETSYFDFVAVCQSFGDAIQHQSYGVFNYILRETRIPKHKLIDEL